MRKNGNRICRKKNMIFSDAAQLWMQSQEQYWKPGTYSVYSQLLNKYILPYFSNTKITRITNQSMDDFASYIIAQSENKNLSSNYVSQICEIILRILAYVDKKYQCKILLPDNPTVKKRSAQIMLPGDNSFMALEHYLLTHAEQDTCLGILIAFHTGIRIGELSALTWNDIHLEEEIIYIRKNILRVKETEDIQNTMNKMTHIIEQSPKTSDSVRIIPIPPKLLPLLRQYRKETSDYVINGIKKPWAEPRTIQYRFQSILKKCEIEPFNFHMLRHGFATRCIAMGLDVKSLSEILGHSNIQITLNLYVHSTARQKRHLMEQYDSYYQCHSQGEILFS